MLHEEFSGQSAAVEEDAAAPAVTSDASEASDASERLEGTVKWFDVKKGFGFIGGPQGEDVFVHFSAIGGNGFRTLRDGEPVSYALSRGDKGFHATEVLRLAPPAQESARAPASQDAHTRPTHDMPRRPQQNNLPRAGAGVGDRHETPRRRNDGPTGSPNGAPRHTGNGYVRRPSIEARPEEQYGRPAPARPAKPAPDHGLPPDDDDGYVG